MISNPLFWITTALLCWSAINVKANIDYEGNNKILRVSIVAMGWLGAVVVRSIQ